MKYFFSMLFACVILSVTANDTTGTVTGSRLNVRTRPMASSEVACQLQKGETVTVLELKGNWVAIAVPSSCKGWIKTSALSGARVKTATQVHMGPTTTFTAIGSVTPGTTVKALRTKGSWTYVHAAFQGRLWVHIDYIALPKGMARPVSSEATPAIEKTNGTHGQGEVVNVNMTKFPKGDIPSTPIVKPENMEVHEMASENATGEISPISTAKRIVKDGVIVKLKEKKGRPFSYALASQINNRFYPLFYLSNSFKDIEKWELHRVTVTGDRQWVRGYPRPVVDVRSITPVKK